MASNKMLVKATRKGQYGKKIRNEGDVFELDLDKDRKADELKGKKGKGPFSDRWMKKVEKGSRDWNKFYAEDIDDSEAPNQGKEENSEK